MLYQFREINLCQVGSDDADAVGVAAVFVTLDLLGAVTIGGQLEDGAEFATYDVDIFVNDDDFGVAIGTQEVAEECVGRTEGVA